MSHLHQQASEQISVKAPVAEQCRMRYLCSKHARGVGKVSKHSSRLFSCAVSPGVTRILQPNAPDQTAGQKA
jgi:hypothetical protein